MFCIFENKCEVLIVNEDLLNQIKRKVVEENHRSLSIKLKVSSILKSTSTLIIKVGFIYIRWFYHRPSAIPTQNGPISRKRAIRGQRTEHVSAQKSIIYGLCVVNLCRPTHRQMGYIKFYFCTFIRQILNGRKTFFKLPRLRKLVFLWLQSFKFSAKYERK